MVSDFLSGNKDRCKLFCYAGTHEAELADSKDYRTNNIDRLMLRETDKSVVFLILNFRPNKIHRLDAKAVTAKTISQMTMLLKKDTYWAADADEKYTQNAVINSECILATDQQNKVVGFVRFISNNDVAYVSDMVVDAEWRKQQIGTALMQQACNLIDDQKHEFSALISAREGDGQVAAPKLYGSKFGFKDYAQGHQHNICFRYIRMTPENQMQYQQLSQLNANNLNGTKQAANPNTFFNNQHETAMLGSGAKLHCGHPIPVAVAQRSETYLNSGSVTFARNLKL